MSKKGQFLEIAGMLIIVGITAFGTYAIYSQKENLYVGYGGIAYKYTECPEFTEKFPEKEAVVFLSLKAAEEAGYKVKACGEMK